jgi:hypothetical protein
MKRMRHSADAHRRLSFAAIIGLSAGPTTAIYGWCTDRFEVKDELRMGNYALMSIMERI